MSLIQIFFLAMFLIYIIPISIWKIGRTDYWAPLVTVQIATGIILGPGIFGAFFPNTYHFIFNHSIISLLNSLAIWGVTLFVFLAGIELNLKLLNKNKKETFVVNVLSIGGPLIIGCLAAFLIHAQFDNFIGAKAKTWQFILGTGMASAVTALPILILFMKKLNILDLPFGQRVLRFASLGDILLWSVLAVILMEWGKLLTEIIFLTSYLGLGFILRKILPKLRFEEKMYASLIWLIVCALGADYSGLHFIVGAFLSGAMLDINWYGKQKIETLRFHVLILLMPIFFLSTGLKTYWELNGYIVIVVSLITFFAQLFGKFAGLAIASWYLNWKKGSVSIIGWLLQTKALIEIIFANILLDKEIISNQMFTALLLMALISTICTIPFLTPKIKKYKTMIHAYKN